jgi:hypothetical protein
MSAAPAYILDLPAEAVTYWTSEIEHAVQVGDEYGIRFLSSDEIAAWMPLYPGMPVSGSQIASNKVRTKEDCDWLYCQMTGFMRTQILAVAASLRLAEHLQEGGRTAAGVSSVLWWTTVEAFRAR